MSGKHPDLPPCRHPLGYTEAEAKAFLGLQFAAFRRWIRDDLLSWDQQGQVRFWVGNVHSYLHQGELFVSEEVSEFNKGL